jgi:hypothetical protein
VAENPCHAFNQKGSFMGRAIIRLVQRNGIALLALFLALGGTTYAASTALIGSNTVASPQVVNGSLKTKDLSAKARKALKGNRGLRGLRGLQGTQGAKGATGAQGIQGPAGPYPDVLASGKTIRGHYNMTNHAAALGEITGAEISFGYVLTAAPTVGTNATDCPGTVANPTAAPGKLCLYDRQRSNVTAPDPTVFNIDAQGADIEDHSAAAGTYYDIGVWAVTAP